MNGISFYQHPFADVFQLTKLPLDWKMAAKEGQISVGYDKQLAKNVININGTTSASNYI
jgi:hypothetical protein